MTTANDIIGDALGKLGIASPGDAHSAEDVQLGLTSLNRLVDAMALTPSAAYAVSEVVTSVTAGAQSLTIGAAQQIAIARPVRLEPGCFTRLGGIDTPLRVVDFSEYAAAVQKSLGSTYADVVYYDRQMPTGRVYLWPAPAACALHLQVAQVISEFTGLHTAYTLPPGFRSALGYMLAEELAPDFGATLQPATIRRSYAAQRAVRRANTNIPHLGVVGAPAHGWWVPEGS